MQGIPCCFAERMRQFALGPHLTWILARSDRHDQNRTIDEYYFYVLYGGNFGRSVALCGPYWRGFCAAYNIEQNDVLTFAYNRVDRCFIVEVSNADNVVKPWVDQDQCMY